MLAAEKQELVSRVVEPGLQSFGQGFGGHFVVVKGLGSLHPSWQRRERKSIAFDTLETTQPPRRFPRNLSAGGCQRMAVLIGGGGDGG